MSFRTPAAPVPQEPSRQDRKNHPATRPVDHRDGERRSGALSCSLRPRRSTSEKTRCLRSSSFFPKAGWVDSRFEGFGAESGEADPKMVNNCILDTFWRTDTFWIVLDCLLDRFRLRRVWSSPSPTVLPAELGSDPLGSTDPGEADDEMLQGADDDETSRRRRRLRSFLPLRLGRPWPYERSIPCYVRSGIANRTERSDATNGLGRDPRPGVHPVLRADDGR